MFNNIISIISLLVTYKPTFLIYFWGAHVKKWKTGGEECKEAGRVSSENSS